MKIGRLGFLGAGSVAAHHARAAKAIGIDVSVACTRRPNSPHWQNFLAVSNNTQLLPSIDSVLSADVDGIVVCLSWDMIPDILPRLAACGKPMLIEKPIAFSATDVPVEGVGNKFVGYNRRFYDVVEKLKGRLQQNDLKSVEVTISESVTRYIQRFGDSIVPRILEFTSSHTLDLLLYLLGPLSTLYTRPSSRSETNFVSYNGLITTQNDVPVFLAINEDDPCPAGIRFRFEDNTAWVLSPLETLTVYKGVELVDATSESQIRKYVPKVLSVDHEDATLKPGFLRQMREFTHSEPGRGATFEDARRVLQLIQEIKNGGCISGISQEARSAA